MGTQNAAYPLVPRAAIRALVVARKDVVLVLVNAFKLGASRTLNTGDDSVAQWLECIIEVTDRRLRASVNIGEGILRDLEGIAFEVIAIKKSGSVRVSSLLMGQPIVAQALLVLSLLSSQTLLPS
jgi:hypothetical protein